MKILCTSLCLSMISFASLKAGAKAVPPALWMREKTLNLEGSTYYSEIEAF
jgi:hypothetical protein